MSKAQIEFLQRCKAFNLHSGSLNDWLDRIEELEHECSLHRNRLASLLFSDYFKPDVTAGMIQDLAAEYTNALAERDALQVDNARLREALDNCRLLAARYRKEEWAPHILRFCESGGSVANPLRQDDSALRELLKAERERCIIELHRNADKRIDEIVSAIRAMEDQ